MLAFDYTLYPFEIAFKPISRPLKSLQEEINTAAKSIAKISTRPLAVALSGGIDSEVICRSLLEQKIDFTVFIMRFIDGHNAEDIQWAFEFCSDHNIDPIVLDVDILKFMAEGTDTYVVQGYQSYGTFRYLQLWLMEQAEQRGYSLIMGGREDAIIRRNSCPVIRYNFGHVMVHLWNSEHGGYHYPSFYETTPELMAAYFDSPVLRLVCQDANYFAPMPKIGPPGDSIEKILTLHHAWPKMQRRDKRTGFERLKEIKLQEDNALRLRMEPTTPDIYLPVAQIRQQLGLVDLSKIT